LRPAPSTTRFDLGARGINSVLTDEHVIGARSITHRKT
jgi:hypothetical protein